MVGWRWCLEHLAGRRIVSLSFFGAQRLMGGSPWEMVKRVWEARRV